MPNEKENLYEKVTTVIVDAVKKGTDGKWKMPWSQSSFLPKNLASYKPYRGANVLLLWAAAQRKGYDLHLWGTYNQWQNIGAQVRKDEKSTLITFWNFSEKGKPTESSDEEGEQKTGRRVWMRPYFVFNAHQVDGFDAKKWVKPEPGITNKRIPEADAFFEALESSVKYRQPKACYIPMIDQIHMPSFEAFSDEVGFYSTLGHEHVHWTGSSARLNRDLSKRFGTETYAFEELIAEMGAAFICAYLGITPQPREDHAQYITSWLKVLKNDHKAIFTAASHSQKALDYMISLQQSEEVAA